MWKLQAHNTGLYISLLAVSLFLVMTALGPGIFQEQVSYFNSWQYRIFDVLCHQDPARSFSVSGVPMAVCVRCMGIYFLFLVGWLLMPVYALFSEASGKAEKNWLIAAILLNLADVTGNYFELWTNTLHSRFLLGSFIGLTAALTLASEFFSTINKSE